MLVNIVTIFLVIYLIINLVSSLPYTRFFHSDIFYKPKEKYLITIDDGPTEYTEKMLKILDKYNYKAIFFVNGDKISSNERIINKIVKKGHTIGNHSYKHYFFNPIVSSVIINNLKINEKKLLDFVGTIDFVRTPHGYQTPGLMKYLKENGKKFVYWDRILFDFIPFIPFSILKKQVDSFINKEGIICLHSNKNSVKILRYLLERIGDNYE